MRRIKWKNVALLPFMFCVGFLLLLGKLCGLTYKQISVVFNLWVQGAVLMLSGVAPAAAAIYQLANGGSLLWITVTALLIFYAAAYVYGFIKMLQHYHLPFDRADVLIVNACPEIQDQENQDRQQCLPVWCFAFHTGTPSY